MSSSNFDDIDEAVKNSDFTIFCDIKDWGSESEFSDFLLYEARHLIEYLGNKHWSRYIMNYYRTIEQKYYLVLKNNYLNIYFNYLFNNSDIETSFRYTDEDDRIKDNNKDNGFYERLQKYYNTYRTDLLRFKYHLADYGNGDLYIIVYIKKSMYELDLYFNFKKRFMYGDFVDYAIKYSLTYGKDSQIHSVYINNSEIYPIYPMPAPILDKVSSEEIINFIRETNFTDEEKERYYLELVYVMASGDKFKENYMKMSDFSDKIFIKELCAKYNLVFSENCFVETMKKLAKMIEVEK